MTGIAWSKRLVKLLAVALVVATTCVALGIWQIARLHQKQQFNAAVRAGMSAPPAPVETLLPTGVDPDAVRYHRAEATGTYDTANEFVLYGRTQNSQAGNHMLTPLRLADGSAILVDRGWVPLNVDQPGAAAVAPPAGEVDVEGVLFASEGDPPGAVGGAESARDHAREGRPRDDPVAAPVPDRTGLPLAPAAVPGATRRVPRAGAAPQADRGSAPGLCHPVVHVRRHRFGGVRHPGASREPG